MKQDVDGTVIAQVVKADGVDMPLWGQLAQHGSGLEQELSAEVAALKDDKQALEEEVVVVRRELAAWRDATRHAACAHVDIETERIKWEGEEKRSTETAMQELTSARQHIWQLHRAASCLSVEAKAEGKNEVEAKALVAADLYVADRGSQTEKLGELRSAIAAGLWTGGAPVELGDVITKKSAGRKAAEDVTIADLTGTGAQDTAIASHVAAKLAGGDAGTVIKS